MGCFPSAGHVSVNINVLIEIGNGLDNARLIGPIRKRRMRNAAPIALRIQKSTACTIGIDGREIKSELVHVSTLIIGGIGIRYWQGSARIRRVIEIGCWNDKDKGMLQTLKQIGIEPDDGLPCFLIS
jgi:hypothetical protein